MIESLDHGFNPEAGQLPKVEPGLSKGQDSIVSLSPKSPTMTAKALKVREEIGRAAGYTLPFSGSALLLSSLYGSPEGALIAALCGVAGYAVAYRAQKDLNQ